MCIVYEEIGHIRVGIHGHTMDFIGLKDVNTSRFKRDQNLLVSWIQCSMFLAYEHFYWSHLRYPAHGCLDRAKWWK